MTAEELDRAAMRLDDLEIEVEDLRSKLREQVEEFGSTPPRAEKSKRLSAALFQFTVSRGSTIEVKDAEVERIRKACEPSLFAKLFRAVTRFKLADGASLLLASPLPEGAPKNLRLMFSRAVETKETSPRLRIEKLDAPTQNPNRET